MNLSFGIVLAPYRVDYYNYLHDECNTENWFFLESFEGQLFSTETLRKKATFPQRILPSYRFFSKWIPKGLLKILKNANPNFVLVPEYSITALIVILIKFLWGFKYKVISQCDDSYDMIISGGFSKWHDLARRCLAPYMDDIVLPDKKAAEWYQQRYQKGVWVPIILDEKKFAYFQNECLENRVRDIRKELELDGKLTVLFVGRQVPEKNIPYLIKACSSLSVPYKLILVGDGPQRDELKKIASEIGTDVFFAGQRNDLELYAWYSASDIFVLPSTREPFGAVTNEALLCGCYCLVSTRAGSACLIDPGVNGEVFDPFDDGALSAALNRVARRKNECVRTNNMTVLFTDVLTTLKEYANAEINQ